MLTRDFAEHGVPSSAFAAETGPTAQGNIFGSSIHDAAGRGGLGLSGVGEGGDARSADNGVALGAVGTVDRASGNARSVLEQGFGHGHCGTCQGGRGHEVRSPSIMVGGTQVTGRLPPEAIQRVVRQGFGRIRGCYARALEQRPDLEGRIAVKFVIGREGEVALASAAERSINDEAFASCVVKGFEALTFPRPVGGIVTVVYPIVFSRTTP